MDNGYTVLSIIAVIFYLQIAIYIKKKKFHHWHFQIKNGNRLDVARANEHQTIKIFIWLNNHTYYIKTFISIMVTLKVK